MNCKNRDNSCENANTCPCLLYEEKDKYKYLRKEYGDLADTIILHDQMLDSGELEH